MNSVTPIGPVECSYRQIGDPAKCAWCGERAKSAFEIYDPVGWVFRLGICGREAKVRSRIARFSAWSNCPRPHRQEAIPTGLGIWEMRPDQRRAHTRSIPVDEDF
jgi:hypothetical protein